MFKFLFYFLFFLLASVVSEAIVPKFILNFFKTAGNEVQNVPEFTDLYKFPEFDHLEVESLDEPQPQVNVTRRPIDLEYYFTRFSISMSYNRRMYNLSRNNIVNDTFKILNRYKNVPDILKKSFKIGFSGERATDIGGLTKEWFSLFSAQVFNPEFGLFEYTDESSSTVHINPLSRERHRKHLLYFELIGLATAMALIHGKYLEVYFSIPFLKTMLHEPIYLQDVKFTDPDFYRSLFWILKNDPIPADLTFIAPQLTYNRIFRLIPNGEEIKVDNTNKKKYIRLMINWTYVRRVQRQMSAFLKGFGSLIPLKLLRRLSVDDLQNIIGGKKNIDLNFWKSCTDYCGGYTEESVQIKWFWNAVENFDFEKRSRLLTFVTGTSRFSVDGRRRLNFRIYRASSSFGLPQARTCFNQLELPKYNTEEELVKMLNIVTEYTATYQ